MAKVRVRVRVRGEYGAHDEAGALDVGLAPLPIASQHALASELGTHHNHTEG